MANAMARDGDLRLDDRFGFTLDPFLDRQNGYFFQVNPERRATRFPARRRDRRAELGRPMVREDLASTPRAGRVEIALPYATINFDPDADVWGLNMARGIRRRDEIDRWSDPSANVS